jgi:hypothetical protein
VILATLCISSCKNQPQLNALHGKWTPLEVTPMSDKVLDSNSAFGFAIANMALSGDKAVQFLSDSLLVGGELKAHFKVNGSNLEIIRADKNEATNCSWKTSHDTLWLMDMPDKGFATVLKRI